MTDRANLPSCSGLERIALCPGSWLAERGLPERENDDAASGTRIHDVLAGKALPSTLTADEASTLDRCEMYLRRAVEAVFGHGMDCCDAVNRQPGRLWHHLGCNRILSGEPDVVIRHGSRMLVADFKTGWGDTEKAQGNLQLRGYALLASWEKSGREIESVTVAIIAPNQDEPLTMARYEWNHIERSRIEIIEILERAHAIPTHSVSLSGKSEAEMALPPQRIPSEKACKYCKALAHCPEARAMALVPPLVNAPENTTPQAIAATLTGHTLGKFLDRARIASAVIEACRDEAKRRLREGEKVPGWHLAPGRKRTTITNAPEVHQRARNEGLMSTKDFLNCITVRKGALEEVVAKNTGAKGRALRSKMEALLDGCVETKTTDEILERV